MSKDNNALFPETDFSTHLESNCNSRGGTLFQRRGENRISSIVEEHNSIMDINKLIIPYNFEQKKYAIDNSQIEFFEKKDYVLETLSFFNSKNTFKIADKYNATVSQKIIVNLLLIIIAIIFLYITLVFMTLLSFNPMIIYTLFLLGRKIYKFLGVMKLLIYERYKLNEINQILINQNNAEFCKENRLKWILGQSGYWLELQKEI